jgi:hypothetical protein
MSKLAERSTTADKLTLMLSCMNTALCCLSTIQCPRTGCSRVLLLIMNTVVCTVVLLLLHDVYNLLYVNDVLACKLLYLAESTSMVSMESRHCATDSASNSDCAVAC